MAVDSSPAGARRLPVAATATLLAGGLMAWDHLWGNEPGSDNSFPVDPVTFVVSLALVTAAALVVFGVTVPRASRSPGKADRAALLHSVVALVLAVPAAWLGFPVVVAGGGIALGLDRLGRGRSRLSIAAVAVGTLVIAFAVLVTAFPSGDGD